MMDMMSGTKLFDVISRLIDLIRAGDKDSVDELPPVATREEALERFFNEKMVIFNAIIAEN
jgi:hypothetical protein